MSPSPRSCPRSRPSCATACPPRPPAGLTDILTEAAPAKVNLYLRVVGRRADGYHLLDSLAVFAGIGDVLRLRPAEGLSLTLSGPEATDLMAEPDNLVLRAARALAAATGITPGASMALEKNLPVASGIGGGSADAAAALRGLLRAWDITGVDLAAIARQLGADVPVCLASRPARMRGVGEILSAAPDMPAYGLLLANPRVAVATPAVFRARAPGFSDPAPQPGRLADAAALADWLRPLGNDLQDPAIGLCPPIEAVLAAIAAQPGCLLARMSGSGATCFGIFPTGLAAQAAAAALPAAWWRWGGLPVQVAGDTARGARKGG